MTENEQEICLTSVLNTAGVVVLDRNVSTVSRGKMSAHCRLLIEVVEGNDLILQGSLSDLSCTELICTDG